jgi:riboflavin synthase
MFTGIVEELGEVVALERHDGAARLTVKGPKVMAGTAHGDSVAVNGVCLTVAASAGGAFTADVMGETLQRSDLGVLAPGAAVNLERPCRAGDPLGGHLVQGHVDGTGRIVSRTRAPHWEVVRITLPYGLARYVAEKGSVAVDGVSLTVSAVSDAAAAPAVPAGPAEPAPLRAAEQSPPAQEADEPWFEVSLIPLTLELTTLGRKRPGELVNVEVDVLAKYVEKLLGGRQG